MNAVRVPLVSLLSRRRVIPGTRCLRKWRATAEGTAGTGMAASLPARAVPATVAAVLFLLPCLVPRLSAAEILTAEDAWRAFRTGQYQAVINAAESAPPGDYRERENWHLARISALLATGQYREALEAASLAMRQDNRSLTLKWAAREAMLANGETQAAAEIPEEIHGLMITRGRAYRDARSLVVYGLAMMELNNDPKAVLDKVFTPAARLDPGAREPLIAAGELALAKNDQALAARKFNEALKLFPDDPDILHGLARAYAGGDRTAMAARLEQALQVNPSHVPSLLLKADQHIDAERYEDAAAVLDLIEKINPHRPEMWAARAVLAHLRHDPEGESAARAKALEFHATNPLPDHLIGRRLSRKYRFAEGAARQKQALEFDPDFLPAQSQLASDLLRLGDEDEGWKLAAAVQAQDAYDVAAYNLMTLRDTMAADFTAVKSDNFTVRMKTSEAGIYGPRVLALLERARTVLGEKYGVDTARPVIVEIFPQQKDFGVRTFGMPDNPGFLGVCFGRVVTAVSPAANRGQAVNWESVLWHEFCHTITLQATLNKMPRWLSEGISVYEERQEDPSWGNRMDPDSREMILSGKLTPVSAMSGAFLAPPSPQHLQFAYYQASLVVEFIISRHGLDSLRAVLRDLAEGRTVQESLAARVAPMETLEREFAAWARELADKMAPALNWDRPDPALLVPGAEEALAAWARSRPDNCWMLLRQAHELLDSQRWQDAKAPLQALLDRWPAQTGPDSAWNLLARVHRELGETEAERRALEKFTTFDSAAPEANLRLGQLASEAGDWPQAARQAGRALAVNPLIAAPWRLLARAAEQTGQLPAAVDAWRTQILLEPSNPAEIHYQLARLLDLTGAAGEARRHVLMALEETPRHRAALKLLHTLNTKNPAVPPAPAVLDKTVAAPDPGAAGGETDPEPEIKTD